MHFYTRSLLFLGLLTSTAAFGRADPSFEIQQSAFVYTQTAETESGDGDPVETTTGEFQSMPSDLEISAKFGHWIFGVQPTAPGESLELTYESSSTLEYGLVLGFNSSNKKEEEMTTKSSSYEFGPRVQYAIDFGDNTVEIEGHLGAVSDKSSQVRSDATGKAVDTKINEAGYDAELVVMYGRSLTENLIVAAGIGYTYGMATEKEEDLDLKTGELQVTLLQFRYGIFY